MIGVGAFGLIIYLPFCSPLTVQASSFIPVFFCFSFIISNLAQPFSISVEYHGMFYIFRTSNTDQFNGNEQDTFVPTCAVAISIWFWFLVLVLYEFLGIFHHVPQSLLGP